MVILSSNRILIAPGDAKYGASDTFLILTNYAGERIKADRQQTGSRLGVNWE